MGVWVGGAGCMRYGSSWRQLRGVEAPWEQAQEDDLLRLRSPHGRHGVDLYGHGRAGAAGVSGGAARRRSCHGRMAAAAVRWPPCPVAPAQPSSPPAPGTHLQQPVPLVWVALQGALLLTARTKDTCP